MLIIFKRNFDLKIEQWFCVENLTSLLSLVAQVATRSYTVIFSKDKWFSPLTKPWERMVFIRVLLKSNSPGKWSKVGNEKFQAPPNPCAEAGHLGGQTKTTLPGPAGASPPWQPHPITSARRRCFYQKTRSHEAKINESGSRVHENQYIWDSYRW